MTQPFRIAIAGLGTVGTGIVRIVQEEAALLAARAGREISIVAVSARSRGKDRGVPLGGYEWEDDPVALARRSDIDLLVEVIGGEDGSAKACVETALASGKHVVTANKSMLAKHGASLARMAEASGVALRFEAAVAGGIPCIKALGEGLAANRIERVLGVMNGTCNYILTRMEKEEADYGAVFAEAQALGYVEADPTLDVGGIDAAHKLALLSALAFGCPPAFDAIQIEGIEQVTLADIEQARDMGYRVRLLGVARRTAKGLEQRMQPCLVPADSPLGQLDGVLNMVVIEGHAVGRVVMQGPGAGMGATASAVMGDVMDVARGIVIPPFGQPSETLKPLAPDTEGTDAAYYLRMMLEDRPGTLAVVASALGSHGVSIDRMRQYGHAESPAPVIIVTHGTSRAALDAALSEIEALDVCQGRPVALRIEAL